MNTGFGKRKIIGVILICTMMSSFCLSGCNITFVLPSGEDETSQTEEATPVVTPEPVISISDDMAPLITEADIAPEEPEYEEIYDPVGKVYSVKPASANEVTLGFVGDVGFAAGYATIRVYREKGSDIHNSMDEGVLGTMQSMDIMMANNEFPYSDRGTPTPDKTYTFRADPKDVHIMKDMGVDIVGLANNHAYDYGPDALIDTIDILNDAKLPFVGAGKNIDEAMRPAYFHVNGHVISIVAATQIERLGNPDTKEATADSPGVLRTLDPAKAVKAIEEAAANSDFTVMFVHWGTESTDLVEQSQRDLAKAYVDAGADLIIGAHPHVLQGIDYIDNVPVFYSLGNFWFNSKTQDTCIVRATLDENCVIKNVEFIPCIQRGSCVETATPTEKGRIIEYMRGISNYAEIDDNGIVTRSETDHNTQNGQNTSPYRKAPTPAENAGGEAGSAQPAQQNADNTVQSEQQPVNNTEQAEQLPDWAVDTN